MKPLDLWAARGWIGDHIRRPMIDRVHPRAHREANVRWTGLEDALDVDHQREAFPSPGICRRLTYWGVGCHDPPGFVSQSVDREVRELPTVALSPAMLECSFGCQHDARPRGALEEPRERGAQLVGILPA